MRLQVFFTTLYTKEIRSKHWFHIIETCYAAIAYYACYIRKSISLSSIAYKTILTTFMLVNYKSCILFYDNINRATGVNVKYFYV